MAVVATLEEVTQFPNIQIAIVCLNNNNNNGMDDKAEFFSFTRTLCEYIALVNESPLNSTKSMSHCLPCYSIALHFMQFEIIVYAYAELL